MKIYLASKSPRRRELLTQMGLEFDLLLFDIPEVILPKESAQAYSLRVTEEKLLAANTKMRQEHLKVLPILCADTEVVLDGKILGKPQDEDEAYQMLKNHSNRTHQVITSVGVIYGDYQKIKMQKTKVTFGYIPDKAIQNYLASKDYQDKSGGYGIQSYIGQFIRHIDGCFYSVMGLPLYTARELLQASMQQTIL